MNDSYTDDYLNGDSNGFGCNRLSMIKEMMESTTQLMTSSNGQSPKVFSST